MPALLFMGRRWGVGGDEFALPSLCSMALRVVWSVALVVILVEVAPDLSSCSDGWLLYSYLACSLSTFALSVVVEWGITRVSTRGSIADTAPRASLSKYLNVHMLLGAFQFFMAALGVALITYLDSTCHGVLTDEALYVLLAVVVASQIVDVLVTCCCCMLMRGNPHEADTDEHDEGGYYERFPPTEIEGQWESRCHWLYRSLIFVTCGLFGGHGTTNEGDFKQLARVMARIFHTEEYLDVVPSDIAAGIVLLYHKQRQRSGVRYYHGVNGSNSTISSNSGFGGNGGGCSGINGAAMRDVEALPATVRARSIEHTAFYKVSRRRVLDVSDAGDLRALEEVAHFSRYALAIYTWYLYVFDRPCCGACELFCHSCTGRSRAFHKSRDSSARGLHESSFFSTADSSRSQSRRHVEGHGARSTVVPPASARLEGADADLPPFPGNQTSAAGSAATAADEPLIVSMRGDNWMGTHEAGLLRVAGLHSTCEIIDAQFKSGIKVTPYSIMVDHAWKCVVIAIRGTMSLDDCLIDLQAEPVSMLECGRRWGFDGTGMFAHQGVLGRAEWVREDLEKEGHIRALLGNTGGDDFTERGSSTRFSRGGGDRSSSSGSSRSTAGLNSRPAPSLSSSRIARCRGYALRITGHSLGGGTGALLAYMMRRDYPSVRCISISPMGGLLNAPFAEECGEFVLSAVLGTDFIPRMSVTSMERMRDEVLELIARSKVNKMTVMRSLVRGRFGGRRDSTTPSPSCDVFGLLYSDDEEVPRTSYYNQLRRYRNLVDEKKREWIFPELLPAGRFVHYVRTNNERRCCGSRRVYTPVWAAPSDFAEIKVSKRMFVDHFPTRSCPAFKEALNRLKKEADDVVAQDSAATDKRTVTEPAPARVVGREGNAINASPADEIL